jgi:hypothetical protein
MNTAMENDMSTATISPARIDLILSALSEDMRGAVGSALRHDGPKECVRRWFSDAASDMVSNEERMEFAGMACAVIRAAVKVGVTF